MNKGNFLRTYPVTTYFALTFLISWGGVIALLAPLGMPLTPAQVSGGIFALGIGVMVAGPFLTGLLMTGLVYGKSGFNNLLLKLGKWKVGLQWYAIALLTSPIFVGIILWILSQQSSVFVPRIVSESHTGTLLLSGITVGLAAGVFEEIGWTGFVIPLMRKKSSVLRTGVLVGGIWGLWHVLVTLWVSGEAPGIVSMQLLIPPLVFYAGVLPVYRVLMVWMYDRTESLLLSILMHASLTTCTTSLFVAAATGLDLTRYYLILTVILWILAANLFAMRTRLFQKKEDSMQRR